MNRVNRERRKTSRQYQDKPVHEKTSQIICKPRKDADQIVLSSLGMHHIWSVLASLGQKLPTETQQRLIDFRGCQG